MKNLLVKLVGVLFCYNCYGQVDALTHLGTNSAWYCGWDANTSFPLNIQHLGTYDINFKIGSTPNQVMTIKGTSYVTSAPGSVGIGTSTPLALLNVDAAIANQGNVFRTDVPSGIGAPQQSLWCMFHGSSSEFRIFHDNTASLFGLGTQSNEPLIFTIAGTQKMILTSGGNLGINTSIPGYKLHVAGTAGVDDMPSSSTNYFVVSSGATGGQLNIRNLNVTFACSTLSNPLNFVSKWNSNSNTELYKSQIYDDGSFVSVNTTSNLGARLNVLNTGSGSFGGWFKSGTTGLFSEITGIGNNQYAIKAEALTSANGNNYAVYAHAGNADTKNVAVFGLSELATDTWGGFFKTSGNGNTNSVSHGVYGLGSGASLNYGVYGDVSGSGWAVYANGNAGGTTIWNPSDAILKTGVIDLSGAMQIIGQLHPTTYYFDTLAYSFMNLSSAKQFGFISEEVELVAPNLVKSFTYPAQMDDDGNIIHEKFDVEYMNYTGYIPILVAAFQEQSTTINSLTQKLSDLEAMIADCCERSLGMRESNSNVPGDFNSQSVELRNLNETYLGQNIPNPYSNQTTIPYFVPNEIGKAQIIFFDRLGRIISKIDLLGRGAGQLTVLAMDLSDGVYSYSLLADDKLVDTKIMVRQH